MSVMFAMPFDEVAIGTRHTTRARTITEADVAAFSALTWDHHPAHTDAIWAADGLFGERVAHGMLTLSCTIGLLSIEPSYVMGLRRIDNCTFRAPVRLGDTIRVEIRVVRKTALLDEMGVVRIKARVLTQADEVAMTCEIDALWRIGGDAQPPVGQAATTELTT